MKQHLFLLIFCLFFSNNYAQLRYVALPDQANTTTQVRAPNGSSSHVTLRAHFIIPASEIGTKLTAGTSIKSIGFNYQSGTNAPASGTFKLYLQNTSDLTNTKGSTWSNVPTGMSLVYNGVFNVPVGSMATAMDLTLGSSFNYTGGGIYVAYEYLATTYNPENSTINFATYIADGNLPASCYSVMTSNTTPGSILGSTSFRPQVRFGIIDTTLPIQLQHFTTTKKAGQASINWQTKSEINNKEFLLSRSTDGTTFKTIYSTAGAVNSQQTRSYQFTDRSPIVGTNYYKLEQRDLDGRLNLVGIRSLKFELENNAIQLYPNPVTDFSFSLKISKLEGKQQIQLYDLSGRKVYTSIANFDDGKATIILNNTLTKGIYLLSVNQQQHKIEIR